MIAERAGVATRSVFHHFEDLESLLADACATQSRRHWGILAPLDHELPLIERVRAVVSQRAELFERISPIRRVAVSREGESAVLATHLAMTRDALALHLVANLAPEFDAVDSLACSGLVTSASWEAWEVLRRHQSLSVADAEASVLELLLLCLTSTRPKERA